jgi:signal transduction histidine kinase
LTPFDLSPRTAALLAVSGLNLLLSGFVWWRYRHQRLLRLFSLFAAGAAFYGVFLAGLAGFENESDALAWIKATSILPYLTNLSFYYFAVVFGQAEGPLTRRVFKVAWALALIDSLGRLSGLIPSALSRHPTQGWFPDPDRYYFILYLPSMVVLVGGGLWLLWRRLRRTDSFLERSQLSYVFLAVGGGVLVSFANFSQSYAFLAVGAPVLFTSVIAYAITRRRLLDIRLLVRRGAVVAALGALFGFLSALAFNLGNAAWGPGRYSGLFAATLIAILFTVFFDPYRRVVSDWIGRRIGMVELEPSRKLLEFSVLAGSTTRLPDMLKASAEKLVADFDLENCSILLPDRMGNLLPTVQVPPDSVPWGEGLSMQSSLCRRIAVEPLGIELDGLAWTQRYELKPALKPLPAPDDFDAEHARAFLTGCRAQAAFGLRGKDRLHGVLMVGPYKSGRGISEDELRFFAALSAQLAAEVQNSVLHGKVQQADRLSSLGTLAASLAHELRNPLTAISNFVQMLPGRSQDPKFLGRFQVTVPREVEKLIHMTEQLLDLARPSKSTRENVALVNLVESVRPLISYEFRKKQVPLKVVQDDGRQVQVMGNPTELSQVLMNLLLNALDATEEGGEVNVRVGQEGDWGILSVRDSGKGMTEEEKQLLFEPYFTTKESGTGLGLAICEKIVHDCGGRILVESQPGQGANFIVYLPLGVTELAEKV